MEQTVKTTKKIRSEKDLWKLFNICTMLFAAISFYTTAEGMKTYFFNGNEICAYFSSLGIQGFLVGLNLKLPKYITKKSSLARWCIITLYSVTVLWSSGFSFVFIANSVYASVWMKDAQIVLTDKYTSTISRLDELSNAAFEDEIEMLLGDITEMKAIAAYNDGEATEAISNAVLDFEAIKSNFPSHVGMLMAIGTLEKLQNGEYVGDLSQITQILGQEHQTINTKINLLNSQIAQSEASIQIANANAANLTSLRAKVLTKSAAHNSYTQQIAIEQKRAAQFSLDKTNAENEKNYQELLLTDIINLENLASLKTASTEGVLDAEFSKIIAELGSTTPDIDKIGILADGIYSKISETMETTGDSTEYAEILSLYTQFQSTLTKLSKIREIQLFLNQKEQILLDTEVLVSSTPSSEVVKQWRNLWNTKLSELKNSLYQLPSSSDDYENTEIKDTSTVITGLQRNWLLDLNGIEKALLYLFSDYPKLAWLSMILSLYFDASPILISLFKYYDKNLENTSLQKKRFYKLAFTGSSLGVLFLTVLLIK